jgi:hypothetical protein
VYQRLLLVKKICLGSPNITRSFLDLRTLQLLDEEHGNQTHDVGGHWFLSSHNVFISNNGSKRYYNRFSARSIRIYVGVHVSSDAIVWPFPAVAIENADLPSIDILASKLVVTNHSHESSSQSRSRHLNNASSRKQNNGLSGISMYPISHVENRADAHGVMSSSQERIIEGTISQAGTHNSVEEIQEFQHKGGAITKTVEFDFRDSAA